MFWRVVQDVEPIRGASLAHQEEENKLQTNSTCISALTAFGSCSDSAGKVRAHAGFLHELRSLAFVASTLMLILLTALGATHSDLRRVV